MVALASFGEGNQRTRVSELRMQGNKVKNPKGRGAPPLDRERKFRLSVFIFMVV